MSQKDIFDLISLIYEAAVAPEIWPDILAAISDAMRGEATGLMFHHLPSLAGNLNVHVRVDPSVVRLYEEHYCQTDIRVKRAYTKPGLVAPGRIFANPPEAMSEDELVGTQIYNDFLKPNGIHHTIVGVISREKSSVSAVTVMRPRRKTEFGRAEFRLLIQVLPHVQRAIALHQRLNELKTKADATKEALDHWCVGWIMVDFQGRVLELNRAAKNILDRRDGLKSQSGILTAERPTDAGRLKAAIRSAVTRGRVAGGISIQRSSGKRPFFVLSTSCVFYSHFPPKGGASAMLFITDPDAQFQPTPSLLKQLYGLTTAESRIVEKLLSGHDLKMAADTLGVTGNTARGYLKQIFHKVGVNRQAELVRLLSKVAMQNDPPYEG